MYLFTVHPRRHSTCAMEWAVVEFVFDELSNRLYSDLVVEQQKLFPCSATVDAQPCPSGLPLSMQPSPYPRSASSTCCPRSPQHRPNLVSTPTPPPGAEVDAPLHPTLLACFVPWSLLPSIAQFCGLAVPGRTRPLLSEMEYRTFRKVTSSPRRP
jgi:hypothetical protein